jgi:hypothetical protein
MAFHNTNYAIVPFANGLNGPDVCGNGLTASTVHEVFCTQGGAVTITALGGGTMTVTLTAGQSVKVLCSSVAVASGAFVGFRTSHQGINNRLLG